MLPFEWRNSVNTDLAYLKLYIYIYIYIFWMRCKALWLYMTGEGPFFLQRPPSIYSIASTACDVSVSSAVRGYCETVYDRCFLTTLVPERNGDICRQHFM